jgi:hypothetical protein
MTARRLSYTPAGAGSLAELIDIAALGDGIRIAAGMRRDKEWAQ